MKSPDLVLLRAARAAGVVLFLILTLSLTASVTSAHELCRESEECQTHGHCWRTAMDYCDTAENSCRISYPCHHDGQCSFDPETEDCIATSEADCRSSYFCDDAGRCHLDAESGTCVEGGDGCRAATVCEEAGLCALVDGRCVVGSSEDCEASQACRERGHCSKVGGHCRATREAHCMASTRCQRVGKCFLTDGAGEVVPDREEGGECSHAGRCAETEACRRNAACSPGPGRACVPGSEEECRRSLACAEEGQCTFLPPPEPPEDDTQILFRSALDIVGPRCIVGGPADCEEVCADRPRCGYQEGMFGPATCGVNEMEFRMDNMFQGGGLMSPDIRYEDDETLRGGGGGDIDTGFRGGAGTIHIGTRLGPATSPDDEDEDADEDGGDEDAGE